MSHNVFFWVRMVRMYIYFIVFLFCKSSEKREKNEDLILIDKELFFLPKSNRKIRKKIQYKAKRGKRLNVCNEST